VNRIDLICTYLFAGRASVGGLRSWFVTELPSDACTVQSCRPTVKKFADRAHLGHLQFSTLHHIDIRRTVRIRKLGDCSSWVGGWERWQRGTCRSSRVARLSSCFPHLEDHHVLGLYPLSLSLASPHLVVPTPTQSACKVPAWTCGAFEATHVATPLFSAVASPSMSVCGWGGGPAPPPPPARRCQTAYHSPCAHRRSVVAGTLV
jgi:hypothetical protein